MADPSDLVPSVSLPAHVVAAMLRADTPKAERKVRVRVLTTSTGYPFRGQFIEHGPRTAMVVDDRTGQRAGWWEGELYESDAKALEQLVEKATPAELHRVHQELERHEEQMKETGHSDQAYVPSFPACYRRILSRAKDLREASPILAVDYPEAKTKKAA